MGSSRIQLTLFIDEDDSSEIEKIRKQYNPLQFKIVKSHVTLCREDELVQIGDLMQVLNSVKYHPVEIRFGLAARFSDGKGVLIPANGDNQQFQELRKIILKHAIANPANHQPHITIMHPRNSTCTDNMFEQIKKVALPNNLIFKTISLIEQIDGGRWNMLKEFELKKHS